MAWLLLRLLVNATAIEDAEQVRELESRDFAERQFEPIGRRQIGTVEAQACAGQVGLHHDETDQPLMQLGHVRLVEVGRHVSRAAVFGCASSIGGLTLAYLARQAFKRLPLLGHVVVPNVVARLHASQSVRLQLAPHLG